MADKFYYGILDTNQQFYCKPKHAPEDGIQMEGERPSFTAEAQADGTWLDVNPDGWDAWVTAMRDSDSIMTRPVEDLWDGLGVNKVEDPYVETQYDQKKALRATKPE